MLNKYLYILGASGSGKSTLAKRLEMIKPSIYYKIVQYTTRPPRPEEINHVDYYFISDDEYDMLNEKTSTGTCQFFEKVENQFSPARYGGRYIDLVYKRWNIVVACIEGFLSGVVNADEETDEIVLLNLISDGDLFIQREGRNGSEEERYNLSVLNPFKDPFNENILNINGKEIHYYELSIQKLREFTDTELLEYMDKIVCSQNLS